MIFLKCPFLLVVLVLTQNTTCCIWEIKNWNGSSWFSWNVPPSLLLTRNTKCWIWEIKNSNCWSLFSWNVPPSSSLPETPHAESGKSKIVIVDHDFLEMSLPPSSSSSSSLTETPHVDHAASPMVKNEPNYTFVAWLVPILYRLSETVMSIRSRCFVSKIRN